jgi:hypothetical protein
MKNEHEIFGDTKMMSERDKSGRRRASELRMERRRSEMIRRKREVLRRSTAVGLPMLRKNLMMIIELRDQRRRRGRKDIGWRRGSEYETRMLELRLHERLLERRRRFDKYLLRRNGTITRSTQHSTCKLPAEKRLQQQKSSIRDRCKERRRLPRPLRN